MTQHSTQQSHPEQARANGPIVVGVDGSDYSREALGWAAEQARLTGHKLVAVTAWEWPMNYGYPAIWPDDVSFEDDARHTLEESIEKTLGPDAKDSVVLAVVHGPPVPTLLAESERASLLVVGSRGHGELAGMLLGSVSEFLATHAHCPVVIVRHGNI